MHPYQVQLGPGLSHDEPIKAALIPTLVDEAARLGLAAQRMRAGKAQKGKWIYIVDPPCMVQVMHLLSIRIL